MPIAASTCSSLLLDTSSSVNTDNDVSDMGGSVACPQQLASFKERNAGHNQTQVGLKILQLDPFITCV